MYNVFIDDKKRRERKQARIMEKILRENQPNKEILIKKYKDRINNNLLVVAKDAEMLPKVSRAGTSCENKRSGLKSTGFLTEKERIEESSRFNKWLDPSPSEKFAFKLRPREKDKEIQPDLKFSVKTGLERLEESILTHKQFYDSSDPPDSAKKTMYKNYFGIEKPKFSGGKQVMDYYHFKTYFKTIESLALDLHSSVRNISKAEETSRRKNENLGMSEIKTIIKDINPFANKDRMCKEEVMPLSCEIMEKFGLWEGRRAKSTNNFKSKNTTPTWITARTAFKNRD